MSTALPEITEAVVLAAVNEVIDPCSTAAGCPGGLVDMGMVRSVELRPGAEGTDVHVVICVTEPLCVMGHVFVPRVQSQLDALPGIGTAQVELDNDFGWTWSEARMDPAYRARLAAHRATRRAVLLTTGRAGTPLQGS